MLRSISYTAKRRGKRLAPRVWGNLAGELGDRALLHTTFTVPKELRARAWSRKWWESRVMALRRQLREQGALLRSPLRALRARATAPQAIRPWGTLLWRGKRNTPEGTRTLATGSGGQCSIH